MVSNVVENASLAAAVASSIGAEEGHSDKKGTLRGRRKRLVGGVAVRGRPGLNSLDCGVCAGGGTVSFASTNCTMDWRGVRASRGKGETKSFVASRVDPKREGTGLVGEVGVASPWWGSGLPSDGRCDPSDLSSSMD